MYTFHLNQVSQKIFNFNSYNVFKQSKELNTFCSLSFRTQKKDTFLFLKCVLEIWSCRFCKKNHYSSTSKFCQHARFIYCTDTRVIAYHDQSKQLLSFILPLIAERWNVPWTVLKIVVFLWQKKLIILNTNIKKWLCGKKSNYCGSPSPSGTEVPVDQNGYKIVKK